MKRQQGYENALGLLNSYLEAEKMRHTPEREHVLRYCCDLVQPFTMDQVVECAKKDFISRNTVYNSVNLFLKAKILHTLNKQYDSSRKPLFELMLSSHIHTQFVCTRCGKVAEFEHKAIEAVIMNKKYTNFIPKHFTLYVYGECKICRRLVNKKV